MTELAIIEAALKKVARLMMDDPAFEPVFARLEKEYQAVLERAAGQTPAQRRAAALLAS